MRRRNGQNSRGQWLNAVIVLCMVTAAVTAIPAAAGAGQGPNDPTNIEPDCYAPGIGTTETALGVDSHVDEVCFEAPQLEEREHLNFYRVDLLISGVDSSPWAGFACGYGLFGGWDRDCGHRQAAYEDVSVTLWFPRNWKNGKDKTLVQYHHSNPFAPTGEELIGLGAIQQGMAYADHDLANGVIVDGPMAGNPVPLVSSSIARDVGAVASDWLDRYTNRAPDLRYITGHSLGSWVITGLMAGNFFGFDMANNHVDPDDLDSDAFYDAAIYIGTSGGPRDEDAVSTTPGPAAMVVPSIFVQGEQEGSSNSWPYVVSLIDLVGEDHAKGSIAWWSLRGQGHFPFEDTPPELRDLFGQDRHGPVLAAALKSLHHAVTKGAELTSYMGGVIVAREAGDPAGDDCFRLPGGPDPDRRVEWQTLDGEATYTDPIKLYSGDDNDLYPGLEPCGLEIDALQRIQDVLEPEPAIVPPLAAHRVGPVHMNWSNLIVDEQFLVCDLYGNLNGYMGALRGTAGHLRGMGVWLPLPGSTGVRVTDVFVDPPFPLPGPFPGIIGTFQEQGCA